MKTSHIVSMLLCGLALGACHDPADYDLTEEQVQSIISLEVTGAASIPADGFTTTTLVARIYPSNANNRTLLISTDRGTLVKGGGKMADGTLTINVGPDGSLEFDLKSSVESGDAVVVVTANGQPLVSASKTVTFEPANPDDTVRFITVPANMPADNASQSTIEVQLNTNIPAASRQATFDTTLGSLIPASKPIAADANGVVRVTLQSPPAVGSTRLTVTHGSVIRQTSVDFVRALPMSISAATTRLTVKSSVDESVEVTGMLSRTPGSVTSGSTVLFEAFRTDTGAPIGAFRNITTSDATGRVSGSFLPGVTDHRGDVELRISTPDRSISGSTLIRIIAP